MQQEGRETVLDELEGRLTVSVETAARACSLSRGLAYRQAKSKGEIIPGVPVLRAGGKYVVPVAPLLRALGIQDAA
jgi:hypothetical protein